MKNQFRSFFATAFIFASLSTSAYASITEIEGIGNTFQGCVSAKIDALHDLEFKCMHGRIEGISCTINDIGQTDHGHVCMANCTAYCITDEN